MPKDPLQTYHFYSCYLSYPDILHLTLCDLWCIRIFLMDRFHTRRVLRIATVFKAFLAAIPARLRQGRAFYRLTFSRRSLLASQRISICKLEYNGCNTLHPGSTALCDAASCLLQTS